MSPQFPVIFGAGDRPALDLNFAATKTLDPRITFTRASTGSYIDSAGALQTASTNIPRFTHNPSTGASLGLLIEESRTNLLLNSGTLSTQNVTVTAQAYTLSFTGTGSITRSGTSTGTLSGTGVGEANRVTVTFTPTAGTLTLTVSGTVTNAQLEAGSFATSYISTAGATATRAADVCTISGTDFSNFYQPGQGTSVIDATSLALTPISGLISFDDGTSSNRIDLRYLSGGTYGNFFVDVGGVSQVALNGATGTGVLRTVSAIAWRAGSFGVSVNGQTPLTSSSGSIPTVNRMRIGQLQGAQIFNGPIARVRYWRNRIADSRLQSLSLT